MARRVTTPSNQQELWHGFSSGSCLTHAQSCCRIRNDTGTGIGPFSREGSQEDFTKAKERRKVEGPQSYQGLFHKREGREKAHVPSQYKVADCSIRLNLPNRSLYSLKPGTKFWGTKELGSGSQPGLWWDDELGAQKQAPFLVPSQFSRWWLSMPRLPHL